MNKNKKGESIKERKHPVSHYLEEYGRHFSYFSMAITKYRDQGN